MNTNQFRQISYITSLDVEVPAAESKIDYRSDLVFFFRKQIRDKFRHFVETNSKHQYVSTPPSVNNLDIQVLEKYRKFFTTIEKYRACASGWRSANSVGPSDSQVDSAVLAIANLILIGIDAPNAMLLDDGTIGAYWRTGQKYVSIDFDADGEYPWAGTDGEKYWSGIWKSAGTFPQSLHAELEESDS
ncbi:hypothetical protein H8L32_05535 [Undibacterium sp. CY18W]|uniref:Uncharacterized protein n=1 Tax=Undibacterium hunanense TaxID=2762292 RepID=A0ABR6ZM04_9BURK|nr:hypothetical protein [Undibacterium hunanense]MBC3916931.1 hypothetical protein [Undibacterium hunanense]